MSRYICKFADGDTAYYLEWSTVVDAPLTFGLPLEEFIKYYREEYGNKGLSELAARMRRVEEKSTSSYIHHSIDELISSNRAGKNGTCLSKEQIIVGFCRNQDEDKIPAGKRFNFEIGKYE